VEQGLDTTWTDPAGGAKPSGMAKIDQKFEPITAAEEAAAAVPAPGIVVTDGPPADQAGGTLTIDLGALVANWQSLGRRVMPAECAAVVKANAYGLGIEQVVPALARAGCKTFFVADLSEARRVRAVAPDAAIYVLSGMLPNTGPAFADIKARPVINSTVELAEWDAFVAGSGWRGGAALHVDTGMNRLGVSINDAAALAPRIRAENHGIHLLTSRSIRSTTGRSNCFAKCASSIAAFRRRWRIRPASSSAMPRIAMSCALAWRSMASIRHQASRTRCSRSSASRRASCRCVT